MKRHFIAWTHCQGVAIVALGLLAAAAPSAAQEPTGHANPRFGDGEPRRAEPRPAPAPAPAPTPPPPSSGGTSGGDHAVARGSGDRNATSGDSSTNSTPQRRRREGRTSVGTAVERPAVPPERGGAPLTPGYAYGYYPWGFGGLGFGGYYYDRYDRFYDPWYGGYSYYPQSGSYTSGFEGALRLKVKPREAEVYVDGYYVGIVDDFDGIFQRLHVEAGPHRLEIRAPGYETLAIDVRIQLDRTTTYEGKLQTAP